MKLKNIAILVLSATVAAGAITYLSKKNEYKPTLGTELKNEAVKVQEKYRRLKAEGKTLDDFTQAVEQQRTIKAFIINSDGNSLEIPIEYQAYLKDDPSEYGYYLQRASFKDLNETIRVVKDLRNEGFESYFYPSFSKKMLWYGVYIGPFSEIGDARQASKEFLQKHPTKSLLLRKQRKDIMKIKKPEFRWFNEDNNIGCRDEEYNGCYDLNCSDLIKCLDEGDCFDIKNCSVNYIQKNEDN